jgi:hypothetical protein
VGTGDSSLGVKIPEREADHSPLIIAEVKNAWSYTSIHPYVFIGRYFVKHKTRLHGVVLS